MHPIHRLSPPIDHGPTTTPMPLLAAYCSVHLLDPVPRETRPLVHAGPDSQAYIPLRLRDPCHILLRDRGRRGAARPCMYTRVQLAPMLLSHAARRALCPDRSINAKTGGSQHPTAGVAGPAGRSRAVTKGKVRRVLAKQRSRLDVALRLGHGSGRH